MNPVNYPVIQAQVKNLIANTLQGYSVVVRLLNNSTVSTVGAFSNGTAKNIDNRQNPTWTTGETARFCNVPGIDFVNPSNGVVTTPQVGGTVEWSFGGVNYAKLISSVGMEMPVPGYPLLFILGVE